MGAGERMDREGHAHDGSFIVWQDRDPFLIDTKTHTGKPMWSHGQTAITEELYRIRNATADASSKRRRTSTPRSDHFRA